MYLQWLAHFADSSSGMLRGMNHLKMVAKYAICELLQLQVPLAVQIVSYPTVPFLLCVHDLFYE